MSGQLLEKVREKITNRSVKKVSVLGDLEVLCKRHSIKGIEAIQNTTDNEAIIAYLADQFLDPEDKSVVFTKEMLLNEVPNSDVQDMLKTFFEANGADSEKMKEVEKN